MKHNLQQTQQQLQSLQSLKDQAEHKTKECLIRLENQCTVIDRQKRESEQMRASLLMM